MSAAPGLDNVRLWRVRVALVAAAVLPILAVAAVICAYGVNVPFYDEWNFAELFRSAENHTLTLRDFLAPHNEHRMVLSQTIYFVTAYLAHGDVRAHMFVNLGFACVISFGIYSMSRSGGRRSVEAALLMMIVTNLIIFGMVQCENWLWAFEGHMPSAAAVGCLAVAASRLKQNIRFPLCILLAYAASYTLAYGLFAWVAVLPVLLVRRERGRETPKAWIALWLLFMFLAASPYILARPAHSGMSPMMILAMYPSAVVNYFFVLLGSPLASGLKVFGLWPLFAVGFLVAGMSLFHLLYFLRFWRDEAFREEAIVWVALLAFPLAASAMITMGRASAGVVQATSSRYISVTDLIVVALIYLTGVVLRHHRGRRPAATCDVGEARIITAGLTVVLCLHAVTTIASFADIEARRRFMLGVKTLVAWSQVAYDEEDVGINVSGPPAQVNKLADSMDRQGLLNPKLMRSDIITPTEVTNGLGGMIESVAAHDDRLDFEGWCVLPDRHDVADGVVLCWARPGEPWHVFAVTIKKKPRPEIAKSLGGADFLGCGWTASVPRSRAPADATMFAAFAFDSLNSRLYRLGQ